MTAAAADCNVKLNTIGKGRVGGGGGRIRVIGKNDFKQPRLRYDVLRGLGNTEYEAGSERGVGDRGGTKMVTKMVWEMVTEWNMDWTTVSGRR